MAIEDIVNVTISIQDRAVTRAGFGQANFLSEQSVFSPRIKIYNSNTDLQADDLAGADAKLYGTKYFGQDKSPTRLYVTKKGEDLPHIQTLVFDADFVTGNDFDMDVNSAAIGPVAFNTDHDTTMSDIATAIAAEAGVSTATIIGGAGSRTIEITGAAIDTLVALENAITTSGATQNTATITTTQNPDEVLTHVASLVEAQALNDDWYALSAATRTEATVLLLAAFIESLNKIYMTASSQASILTSSTSDTASLLKALGLNRTQLGYSADEANFPEGAFLGGQLPNDAGSITWKFKPLAGIAVDDQLSADERSNVLSKNAGLYVTVGGVGITCDGKMASGRFIDTTRGIDFVQARITEEVFDLLVNSPKVPFTDDGVALIEGEVKEVLALSVDQGILAADPAPATFVPKVADVSSVDKAARTLNDVDFTATLAGAVHKTVIQGSVSV